MTVESGRGVREGDSQTPNYLGLIFRPLEGSVSASYLYQMWLLTKMMKGKLRHFARQSGGILQIQSGKLSRPVNE